MDLHAWPPYRLRITTPRLELRLPDLASLDELAAVAAAGVHDAGRSPFTVPWTDGTPQERGRATFQHVLGTVANWRPEEWTLSLAVRCDGRVVGRQDVSATDFAVTREAETGSWLGLAHQGRGIGTEMRAAALHLAFAGLGARAVTSAAMTDNPASLRVSEKLGYAPDGVSTAAVRGAVRTLQRLRLDRASWEAHRTVPVEVHGLDACREFFG
ncbi:MULTISPECIES: GNAT family N-acetyltransferase [Streptomyces]|uniref:GNAT family N-acetyltransferase n=1 Tax=Streptomyces TaxID=1883 RepID=UPI001F405DD1|nr:GNAT family protein [Streptomyces noursei]MCE4943692.1 GNAT family N-acetyltransferase [Streptomyces noursei]